METLHDVQVPGGRARAKEAAANRAVRGNNHASAGLLSWLLINRHDDSAWDDMSDRAMPWA